MITVNGNIIEQNRFPDNTLNIKVYKTKYWEDYAVKGADAYIAKDFINHITWHYEDDSELFTLICIRRHLADSRVDLFLPYVPNARMDRVKEKQDVFTLKYFCEVINSLNFEMVTIIDPHSNVTPALIDRVRIINAETYIKYTVDAINNPDLVYFFPDEGASKRYALNDRPSTYANKKRDWATGKIEGLQIVDPEVIKDKPVLIVDDICSRGGTFYYSVKELRKYTDKPIYLYVSHCEETVLLGDLYKEELVDKIYTTNMLGNLEELDDKYLIETVE